MGQAQGYGVTPGTPEATVPHGQIAATGAELTQGTYAGTVSTPGVEAEDTRSTAIKRDIDHTRAEMDATIDALSARLRPARLLDDAMSWARGGPTTGSKGRDAAAVAKNAGSTMLDQVKQHPLAAGLVGAGMAWLLIKGPGKRVYRERAIRRHSREPDLYGGSYVDARTGESYDRDRYGAEQGTGAASRLSGAVHGITDKARHATQQAASSVGETVSGATESVRNAASSAATGVRSRAGNAVHTTTHALSQGYSVGCEKVRNAIDEYPLAVGGVALGAGLLLGLLVPETPQEERLIGEKAHQFRDRAQAKSKELLERGRQITRATAEAVKEEVKHQGLTPAGLIDQVAGVAGRVKGDVQQGLGESLKEKVTAVAQKAKEVAAEKAEQQSEATTGGTA